jgi:hypothetical protein
MKDVKKEHIPKYDKFLWLELIGFDNRQEDMGVGEYIDNLGFIPDGISIFMSGADFVHFHNGLKEDEEFPADIGAYLTAGSFEKKQADPAWTKYQLKAVINGLHSYGVKVYFSVFTISLGDRFHKEWINEHPEVAISAVKEWQKGYPVINPLKRLNDGSFYEDFFVEKLVEVSLDYEFDGYHLVDGYNHGWLQLCHADYSDDMLGQFLEKNNTRLPDNVIENCGNDVNKITERGNWIWHNKRREWIDFHVERWEHFYRKVVDNLHRIGKEAVCNTCWTRDPLEAIYRYGIDYKKLAAAGIDRFVIETCGAGGEMLSTVSRARFSVPFFHVIMSTSLLTKAYIPEAEICFNNCTQDITEGWSILRHAPAFLEKEIYSYSNLYNYDKKGNLERCFDGLQVCLAASIYPEEWQWLKGKWDLGFSTKPVAISDITLVWSDKAFAKELDDYLNTRCGITSNILYHLMAKGAPVYSSINIEHLKAIEKPVLIINPHLYPVSDIKKIIENKKAPVIMIGRKVELPYESDFEIEDVYKPNQMSLNVYGVKLDLDFDIFMDGKENIPDDFNAIKEAPTFFDEQYFRKVSNSFWNACISVINLIVDSEVKTISEGNVDSGWLKVQTIKKQDGKYRLLIANDCFQYAETDFVANYDIAQIKTISQFYEKPITPYRIENGHRENGNGNKFFLRFPPKGMGVVDIEFKKE